MHKTYQTRLLDSADVLRAAARYVEHHGYYMPLDRVEGNSPDFDWDNYNDSDHYDLSSPTPLTPAASELGAIAAVVYGRPNPKPEDDGSPEYQAFIDAVGLLTLFYAPDGENLCGFYRYGYGWWIFPHELAAALRTAANDCEHEAKHHPDDEESK